MSTTKTWAESLNVEIADNLSPIPGYSKTYAHTAREVATRAIILQGVVAVAYEVAAQPIVGWFQEQGIWADVTPNERGLLLSTECTGSKQVEVRWKQNAHEIGPANGSAGGFVVSMVLNIKWPTLIPLLLCAAGVVCLIKGRK